MLAVLHVSASGLALNPALNNYRDLGGTPAAPGRVIANHRLLRSATPANASPEAVEHLHQLGLRTIIDLRRPDEAAEDDGDRLLTHGHGSDELQLIYVPMSVEDKLRSGLKRKAISRPRYLFTAVTLGLGKKISPSRRLKSKLKNSFDRRMISLLDSATLDEIYWWVIKRHGPEIRSVIETCAESAHLPVLLHCTHGKDRTGLAVAMCLHICGVDREHIAQDYARSNEWGCSVEGRRAMEAMLPAHLVGSVDIGPWCEAPEEVLLALLAHMDEQCGSVDAFLDSIGVGAALRARCAAALTVPAGATH